MKDAALIDPAGLEDSLCDCDPIEYESELHQFLAEESVDAIQSQPFVQVRPTAPIRQAIHALHGSRVSVLLVVDDERVIGILTERDVLERVAEQYPKLAHAPVSDVMTCNPAVVYESDPAGVAAIAVAGHRHVPVLGADDRLSGFVSPRRVFSFIEEHFD